MTRLSTGRVQKIAMRSRNRTTHSSRMFQRRDSNGDSVASNSISGTAALKRAGSVALMLTSSYSRPRLSEWNRLIAAAAEEWR